MPDLNMFAKSMPLMMATNINNHFTTSKVI
jgi:hypothetical protein